MASTQEIINNFFTQLFVRNFKTLYTDKTPVEMMASEKDEDGWYNWKPIKGTLDVADYRKIEKKFNVEFPKSFIDWHRSYFFMDADCSLIRLPHSLPTESLQEVIDNLDNGIAEDLIKLKIYPFGQEGNDVGPLVFDGRNPVENNEFPIRVYDYNYGGDEEGLSEIVFSSFPKLLQCITPILNNSETRRLYEIIPEFFAIDPEGAGKTGIDYWLAEIEMGKDNDQYLRDI